MKKNKQVGLSFQLCDESIVNLMLEQMQKRPRSLAKEPSGLLLVGKQRASEKVGK